MVSLYGDRISKAPDLLSIRQRQTPHRILFLLTVVIDNINSALHHRGAGIALTHLDGPQLSRSGLLPGTRKSNRRLRMTPQIRTEPPCLDGRRAGPERP